LSIFETLDVQGHDQLVFWCDPDVGYLGVIAVHDTSLGPGMGGTRFWEYGSEDDAVADALRLS